jgi:hypothetical protein
MISWDKQTLTAAHKHSIFHRLELTKSFICGCFYCLHIFKPKDVLDWVDEDNPKGATALCPKCGIDSVIGSESGYPVDNITFLKELNQYYF